MKRTFLCRITSAIVALSMLLIPVPTGTFAVETGPDTAEMAAANNDIETDLELGAIPPNSQTTDNGAFPDGTDGSSEADEAFGDTSNSDKTEEPEQGEIALIAGEETHIHDGVDGAFKACSGSLPTESGNYYLDGDVNGSWTIPDGVGVINLCLNRHTINGQITVSKNTTLNIYDEAEDKGTINGPEHYSIFNNGTVNIYGGNISNGDFGAIRNEYSYLNVYGGTIAEISNSGHVKISGGNVENLHLQNSTALMRCDITGGTIEVVQLSTVYYDNAETKSDEYLYLSGNAEIGEINLGRECKINIVGKLENTEPYKIVMDEPGVFTKSASGNATEDNFVSGMEYYEVAVNEDGELMLQSLPHRHEDGKVFTAWIGGSIADGS